MSTISAEPFSLFPIELRRIDGSQVSTDAFRGNVLLIVNVASQCVFTSQYKGLEELHEKYSERGLRILGFPCNQFGNQEPGKDEEIKAFCSLKYDVQFDMFSKVDVNGVKTHPLFELLKKKAPGAFGIESIKWNFTKFLVHRDGKRVVRYSPMTNPARLEKDIESALMEPV